jgi:hypothetical protein
MPVTLPYSYTPGYSISFALLVVEKDLPEVGWHVAVPLTNCESEDPVKDGEWEDDK